MLARVARLLPGGLRASPQSLFTSMQQQAGFSELNLSDRETLKKFVGIEELLGREVDARGKLTGLLGELRDAVAALPADADYRRAVEATVAYRLKVLDANDSDAAAEEVFDSHLEELILECREELNLVPIMAGALGCVWLGWLLHHIGNDRLPLGVVWKDCQLILGFPGCWDFKAPAPALAPAVELLISLPTPSNLNPLCPLSNTPPDNKPWDVPADYQAPVYDYTTADTVLGGSAPK
jgi:hypothetical protein